MKTGFYDVGGTRYYSNSSGAMLTGWQKISGNWYYFNKSGAMQKSTWISGTYWVGSDGIMATNIWIDKYHVDANGKWDATR
jgi:glucan-binding YG repeat protein